MNQTEADSVKDLAKPVVEALKKVTERKCPQCLGNGYWKKKRTEEKITCDRCNGTGKVKVERKEATMTKEETLVNIFTEVFKCLGELQRMANELETYLEKKDGG